jgi:hypothetical protein
LPTWSDNGNGQRIIDYKRKNGPIYRDTCDDDDFPRSDASVQRRMYGVRPSTYRGSDPDFSEKIGQLAVQAGANVSQGKKVEEKIPVTEENVEDSSE